MAGEHPTEGKTNSPICWGTLGDGVIQQKRHQTKLYSLIKIITQTSARFLGQRASKHSSGSGLFNKVLPDLKKIMIIKLKRWGGEAC